MLERHHWAGNIREVSVLAMRAHIEMRSRGRVRMPLTRENGTTFYATGPQESLLVDGEKKLEIYLSLHLLEFHIR